MPHSQQPTVNCQQSTANGQQPTVNCQHFSKLQLHSPGIDRLTASPDKHSCAKNPKHEEHEESETRNPKSLNPVPAKSGLQLHDGTELETIGGASLFADCPKVPKLLATASSESNCRAWKLL